MDDAEAIASETTPENLWTYREPRTAMRKNAGARGISMAASFASLIKATTYAEMKNDVLAIKLPTFSDVPDCTTWMSPLSRDDTSPALRVSKKATSCRSRLSKYLSRSLCANRWLMRPHEKRYV